MSTIQVGLAKGEIEAALIKGYLESAGIQASIGTSNSNIPNRYNPSGPHVSFGVYVEEDKAEEAKKILADREAVGSVEK